jgi:lipopolysaccharide transport system ATP-binding protein
MDSEVVIRVDALGKRYVLGAARQPERYTALRDVLAERAKALLRRPFARRRASRTEDPKRDFWALQDVSFDVRRGEVIGIIGRNGAGKSTLLKILSRITEPTRGTIRLRGRVASLLEVGTGFHPELTGRENIFLNGAILGMRRTEIRAKFDEIVAFAEIERFLDTPVKRYSSGMYVRLAFAVAAHLEPEILIIDEVLAVGDAEFQKKCLGKMQQVAREDRRTVIFVSHNMAAVNALCSRVLWLQKGALRATGPSARMVETYLLDGNEDLTSERRWTAEERPANAKLRLRAVRLLDAAGVGRTEYAYHEDIHIELEYELRVPVPKLRVCIRLLTPDATVAFQSNDDASPGVADLRREPGSFSSCCIVPGQLLNCTTYFLTVTADDPFVEVFFQEEGVLRLEVQQTSRDGGRLGESFPGAVHPALEWRVTRQPELRAVIDSAAEAAHPL